MKTDAPTYEEFYSLRLPHRDCPSTWQRGRSSENGLYDGKRAVPFTDDQLAEAERRAGNLKLAD